ncbi:DUF565 domain-containing protein [Cyanobium sp. FGCU-6]|jgi:hypothetical protein|nr:DUF565 domain-containing protein [Cyanobium sp. FGCU6]
MPTSSPRRLRYQQTRFQRNAVQVIDRLTAWAGNPWRRMSLLLIVLLVSFGIGTLLGSITGQLAYLDPISALVCVLAIELASRCRRLLLERPGEHLGLELLDMGRIGLLYGLLLDGFKLL